MQYDVMSFCVALFLASMKSKEKKKMPTVIA